MAPSGLPRKLESGFFWPLTPVSGWGLGGVGERGEQDAQALFSELERRSLGTPGGTPAPLGPVSATSVCASVVP